MRIVFGNWKYIVKNIWYVLPFALIPAVFLALSIDYTGVSDLMHAFFTGEPRADFVEYLRVWSFLRIDSWVGGVYSVLAIVCTVIFMSFMLAFVEKHMRIGKRTVSGVFSQLGNVAISTLAVTLVYFALYEIWSVIVSALLFVISQIRVTALVYILFLVIVAAGAYVLLYLASIFYLWLPCRQITGFGVYDAFLYSYHLAMGVRWKLILSWTISFSVFIVVAACIAMLPEYVFRLVTIVMFAAMFMSFGVRMETVYFEADKLDREDEIRSYREL